MSKALRTATPGTVSTGTAHMFMQSASQKPPAGSMHITWLARPVPGLTGSTIQRQVVQDLESIVVLADAVSSQQRCVSFWGLRGSPRTGALRLNYHAMSLSSFRIRLAHSTCHGSSKLRI